MADNKVPETTSEPLEEVWLLLPEEEIARLERIAAAKGVDYLAMVGTWIEDRAQQEEAKAEVA